MYAQRAFFGTCPKLERYCLDEESHQSLNHTPRSLDDEKGLLSQGYLVEILTPIRRDLVKTHESNWGVDQ